MGYRPNYDRKTAQARVPVLLKPALNRLFNNL